MQSWRNPGAGIIPVHWSAPECSSFWIR